MRALSLPLTLAALALATSAHAAELVVNGGFQNGGPDEATGWTQTGLPLIANNSAWTNGLMPTRSVGLGGYTNADDSVSQAIATAGYGSGVLTFDFVWEDLDNNAGNDFFTVSFGGTTLETFDLGATPGNALGNLYRTTKSYDLTPYFDDSTKTLTLRGTTDGSSFSASSAYVDNVSIQAQPVPEPATLAALGFGVALFARRKARRS